MIGAHITSQRRQQQKEEWLNKNISIFIFKITLNYKGPKDGDFPCPYELEDENKYFAVQTKGIAAMEMYGLVVMRKHSDEE